MISKILILLFIKIFSLYADKVNTPKVCLKELGCLKGTHMPGYQSEKFEAFMGIPYAKPPIGELRFKNPEPITAWPGVLSATQPKADCLQKNYIVTTWPISGEEDCLYLNVYRPVHRTAAKLPVVFYIHGGGYFSGSVNPGFLGPEYFMDTEAVILVMVAYRLGPFGFLSTGDESMSGNFGLKDQNVALKWVHDNINAFDGDPQSVTIFGHSAGASSVHFHMLSPASKGLFQRSILMSGTAIASYSDILKQPHEQAIKLAEFARIPNARGMTTDDLAAALRSANAQSLLNAGDFLRIWNLIPITTFRPTIEGDAWSNAFLTEQPATLLRTGNFKHVPWMMGVIENKGEGVLPTLNILENAELRMEFNKNFDYYLMKMLELPPKIPDAKKQVILDGVIAEYLQGRHQLSNVTVDGFRELIGDAVFYYPFYKSLRHYLHYGDLRKNPVYLFKFKYRGPYSYSTIYTGGSLRNFGAVHYDDLLYLFRSPLLFPQGFPKDSRDAQLVKAYVGLFVEFAKHGKVPKLDGLNSCTKTSFVAAGDFGICNYLNIDNDGEAFQEIIQNDFNVKRMHFWDEISGYPA